MAFGKKGRMPSLDAQYALEKKLLGYLEKWDSNTIRDRALLAEAQSTIQFLEENDTPEFRAQREESAKKSVSSQIEKLRKMGMSQEDILALFSGDNSEESEENDIEHTDVEDLDTEEVV